MTAKTDYLPLDVNVHEVKALIDAEADFLLLDCREQAEYDLVQIEGAKLLPMSTIQNRLPELVEHQHRHIIVHCHHGGRSQQVTEWLRAQDYNNVQNMAGGIDAWSVEIDPSKPRYA